MTVGVAKSMLPATTSSWLCAAPLYPAGLPADIVRKVNAAINAGMAQPDNQGRIRQEGMIIAPMDADTFNAFVAHEALRWKPVILKAGLKME